MDADLSTVARALLAPLVRLGGVGDWRLTALDAEQGISLLLENGPSALLVELEPADPALGCWARTRAFNVCARRQFAGHAPLAAEEATVVDAVVELVRQREGRLPIVPRAAPRAGSEVREIRVTQLLVPEASGHYYVNPYVGCIIGCDFCFVADRADLSRRLVGRSAMPWGRWLDVKVNAREVLEREVRVHPPGIVRFSPILTDPYQPVERRHRVTRTCLEVLRPAGFVPVILTRAARVLEDLELLASFPRAAVGLSIPTDDDRLRQVFEPGADPVEERIEALERLRAAGLRTFLVVQPVFPMNDEAAFVRRLAPLADAVRIDRMHRPERLRARYAAAGIAEAASPEWGERAIARLGAAFAARGVAVDELDDLSRLVGTTRAAGAPRIAARH